MKTYNYHFKCTACSDTTTCLLSAPGAECKAECPWGDKDCKWERIPREEFQRLDAENNNLYPEDKEFNEEYYQNDDY